MTTALRPVVEIGEQADGAIRLYQSAQQEYAALVNEEALMEAERCVAKAAAVLRLMSQVNPTSAKGAQHSASSAEDVVETDPEYAGYLARQRDVVYRKNQAGARAESAKLRAKLAIALIESQGGGL